MTKTYTYKNSNNKTITVYTSEFMPFECISQFVPVFDYSLTNIATKTNYRNPSPNSPNSNWFLNGHLNQHINIINLTKPQIVNAYLKINILYRYNKPDGIGLNDIVNFETYKYEIEGTTINNNILSLPNIIELSSPSELTIENRDFTANETIFAWDKITLKGVIKTSNNADVIIKSAGEIVIDQEATIDPQINLLIGKPGLCNPTRIQPKIIDASFCTDANKYKGNITLSKNDNTTIHSPTGEAFNKSVLYPNPTTNGDFIIQTTLADDSYINVYIYDIAGKLLYEQQSNNVFAKGNINQEFANKIHAPGIYFVEVETTQGRVSYKLIKN